MMFNRLSRPVDHSQLEMFFRSNRFLRCPRRATCEGSRGRNDEGLVCHLERSIPRLHRRAPSSQAGTERFRTWTKGRAAPSPRSTRGERFPRSRGVQSPRTLDKHRQVRCGPFDPTTVIYRQLDAPVLSQDENFVKSLTTESLIYYTTEPNYNTIKYNDISYRRMSGDNASVAAPLTIHRGRARFPLPIGAHACSIAPYRRRGNMFSGG